MGGGTSSFRIVPVAVTVPRVAFVAFVNVTVNVSSVSTVVSSRIVTDTVTDLDPTPMVASPVDDSGVVAASYVALPFDVFTVTDTADVTTAGTSTVNVAEPAASSTDTEPVIDTTGAGSRIVTTADVGDPTVKLAIPTLVRFTVTVSLL